MGMHRSGTSFCIRALHQHGIHLPPNFLPPAADNPEGFQESADLVALKTPGWPQQEPLGGRIGEVQSGRILAALGVNEYAKGGGKKRDRYFAIDRTSSSALQPGIYRAKDETISRLFSALDAPPSVPRM